MSSHYGIVSVCMSAQRPIVEFSLEDGRKLKLKAMRLQKSKEKLASDSGAEKVRDVL